MDIKGNVPLGGIRVREGLSLQVGYRIGIYIRVIAIKGVVKVIGVRLLSIGDDVVFGVDKVVMVHSFRGTVFIHTNITDFCVIFQSLLH